MFRPTSKRSSDPTPEYHGSLLAGPELVQARVEGRSINDRRDGGAVWYDSLVLSHTCHVRAGTPFSTRSGRKVPTA